MSRTAVLLCEKGVPRCGTAGQALDSHITLLNFIIDKIAGSGIIIYRRGGTIFMKKNTIIIDTSKGCTPE
jgi:hypothetical protein